MSHHHQHPQEHKEHDFVAANEVHYDASAGELDTRPEWIKLARDSCEAMHNAYPELFDKENTTVLDFACGPGLISRELYPFVKSLVGVDISQGVVDVYNRRVAEHGIPPEKMKAVRATLKGEEGELDGAKFDVIVCAAAYHHFPDVNEITRILYTFLKPGGALLITDGIRDPSPDALLADAEVQEKYGHVIAHKGGFSDAEVREIFENAGLVGFDYRPAGEATWQGRTLRFFLARGLRKETE
ncbi:S-adenosyl-L-methionine-dependent methyltransferase [Trametopsis cervina]|nr:S-adenosyl-L-methionine-dependent methyltransferase [Trametopsis cervina]